jgi:Protein of unknown function (DUF2971)
MATFAESAGNVEALIRRLESLPFNVLRTRLKPRFLYKFRQLEPSNPISVDRIRDVIVRSRFWLSSPLDFNDPFDTSTRIVFDGSINENRRRVDEILKEHGLNWKERQKERIRILSKPHSELEATIAEMHSEHTDKMGVYSFGGDPLSILMWSHYASNHQGICLQFDAARDPRTLGAHTATMHYSVDYSITNWTTDWVGCTQVVLLRKHPGWSYERESRILVPEHSNQYISFRPDALRSIIVGCCGPPKSIEQLRELIRERSDAHFPVPMLYRAFKHNRKYKLLFKSEQFF